MMVTMQDPSLRESLRSRAPRIAALLEAQTEPRRVIEAVSTGDPGLRERVAIVDWHYCISLDGERFWVQTNRSRWNVYTLDQLADVDVFRYFIEFNRILPCETTADPAA